MNPSMTITHLKGITPSYNHSKEYMGHTNMWHAQITLATLGPVS